MTYPLEAARKLRAEELEAAKRALAAAIEGVSIAEQALARVQSKRDEHARATREAQLEVTGPAQRSAAELLQGQAYLDRRRSEAVALAERVAEAESELANARARVEAARAALADARAQAEAVERHHAKWVAEAARKAERKAEDEADDRNAW